MSDIFLAEDVQKVLHNKFVVILGDSVQRAIYKDLVLLVQENTYLKDKQLRTKGEFYFMNDELLEGGQKGVMTNGTNYREVRQYHSAFHLIRFYFLTRCYGEYMEMILKDFQSEPKPDLIIMNSCLWDITRYGSSSVSEYKKNLITLYKRFREVLNEGCLCIWNTTMPIASNARGGFLIPEIEFMNDTLRLDIMEANFFARQVAVKYDYDILDLHYYFRRQLHRRASDGVHWDMTAHRRISNLIMTHVCEAWGLTLPNRIKNLNTEDTKDTDDNNNSGEKTQPKIPLLTQTKKALIHRAQKKPYYTGYDMVNGPLCSPAYQMSVKPSPMLKNVGPPLPLLRNVRNEFQMRPDEPINFADDDFTFLNQPSRHSNLGSGYQQQWTGTGPRVRSNRNPVRSQSHRYMAYDRPNMDNLRCQRMREEKRNELDMDWRF